MKEFILFLHPIFSVFGVITTVWVLVEILNTSDRNSKRISVASVMTSLFMTLTWITSGYWYIVYYATDKTLILKGPWAFAHSLVMETKEHVFFSILILSLLLPMIALRNNLATNKPARMLVYVVTVLIIFSAIALEGTEALISFAVRMSLLDGVVA